MVSSAATTVSAYLAALPPERRRALEKVRKVIRANLPAGFEEGMLYGMIGYCVPLSRYPDTYNGQPLSLASLASQKNYMSLYLMTVYGDREHEAWFRREYAKAGKKLDMGKSCVRFQSIDDLPLPLVGEVIGQASVEGLIESYEKARTATKKPAKKTAAAKKPAASKKKPAAKKKATAAKKKATAAKKKTVAKK